MRVVIVGAGPAGVRAAETLVDAGVRPVLVDEADEPGGQAYRQRPVTLRAEPRQLYGFAAAKAAGVHAAFERIRERVDHRPRTLAWNVQDGQVHLHGAGGFAALSFDALVLATGATDRVLPLPGWTRPGCYSLGGAQIALKYQGCAIGSRVVFAGSTPLLYLVAYQYATAGARVAAVLDTGSLRAKASGLAGMSSAPALLAQGCYYVAALAARGVPIHHAVSDIEIASGEAVTSVRFRDARARLREMACDAVGMGFHLRPETQLAELAGCEFHYDTRAREWLPVTDACGRAGAELYLAGDGCRIEGADAAEAGGALAALAVLADRGIVSESDPRIERLLRERERHARFQVGIAKAFPFPAQLVERIADDVILCRCEAITAGEFRKALRTGLGAADVNRGKAFSRVGMGRCQGRYCGAAAAELVAQALGTDRERRHDAPGATCALEPGVSPVRPARTMVCEFPAELSSPSPGGRRERRVPADAGRFLERAGRLRAQAPVKPLPLGHALAAPPAPDGQ